MQNSETYQWDFDRRNLSKFASFLEDYFLSSEKTFKHWKEYE